MGATGWVITTVKVINLERKEVTTIPKIIETTLRRWGESRTSVN